MKSHFVNIQAVKEYVREHSDLARLIEEDVDGIEFKQEGNGVLVACSPFREEDTPSFKVSGTRFKDWGGQQYSGDIFAWVQIWHNLSFVESIEYVAERFQLELAPFKRDPTPQEIQRARYLQINQEAAVFCHEMLRQNIAVRDDYMSRSGFNLTRIEPYQVGYSPDREVLIDHLSRKFNITQEEIDKLEFNRNDLWKNSIIYPVHNHRGEVLFFYTKEIKDDAVYKGMKTAHPLHDPSVLYGMHVARKKLRENGGRIVVVEGQRDAIALEAAACMTSSLTEKQREFLKEFKINTIIICYDNDRTGWLKSIEMVNKPPVVGDAIILITRPPGLDQDPHELWREHGDEAIYKMLSGAKLPIEFYVNTKYTDFEGRMSITDQETFLSEIKDFLTQITGVQLHMAAAYLARVLNSNQQSILDYVAEIKVQYSALYNVEAERTLVAYCMNSPAALSTARAAGIEPNSFTLSYYKRFYEATIIANNKHQEHYTPQLVLDEAMAKWADSKLPDLLPIVLEESWKYKEAAACEIVLDMWRRRSASEQANNLVSASRDLAASFTEIVENHRKNLIVSSTSSRKQARTPRELADEFWDELKFRHSRGGNVIIGHSIGGCLPSIDAVLGGIQPHYTVVAGDSGAGKSMLGMNILKCLAIDANVPVLWIGQEMHSKENTARLVSIMTGIDNSRIQSGSLSKKEVEEAAQAREKIAMSGYHMARPMSGHIDEILSIIDEYRWKYDIQAVIWDYIQLITTAQDQDRWSREQVIGHASTTIKNRIVGDMGLAAVIIAQMNRDKLSAGQHKIAGSYRIIQDCDNFLWIEKKTKKQIQEDGEGKGNRFIQVGKRRGGVSDIKIHSKLMIDPGKASLRIEDLSPPSDIGKLYSRAMAA